MDLLSLGKNVLLVLEVLLIFNLLIIVHELGHFLAARWRGLVIEKFGIWFGKPLWKKTINGVEYSLGSIPAGGFVALPQLAPMEAIEGKGENDRAALPPVSPLDKIIVAFAGPLFSFGLAALFAVIVWVVGKPVREAEATRIIGYVPTESPAKDKLLPGDTILEIDGHPVKSFLGMNDSVVWYVMRSEGDTVAVTVERGGQRLAPIEVKPFRPEAAGPGRTLKRQLLIEPAGVPSVARVLPGGRAEQAGFKAGDLIVTANGKPVWHENDLSQAFDATPGQPVPVTVERGASKERVELTLPPLALKVGSVMLSSPADKAGFKVGDIIQSVDGRPVTALSFSDLTKDKLNQPVAVAVRRGNESLTLSVTPLYEETRKRAMIGLGWAGDDDLALAAGGRMALRHPSVGELLIEPVYTIRNTLGALFAPKSELGVRDLSGPLGIMKIYGGLLASEQGWRLVLWFSVFINVNLALMNLLPIPVLDGGHITLALVEAVRRRPLNLRVLEWVQTACALLIIGFMLYVTVFDVLDWGIFRKKPATQTELKFTPPPGK